MLQILSPKTILVQNTEKGFSSNYQAITFFRVILIIWSSCPSLIRDDFFFILGISQAGARDKTELEILENLPES